MCSATSSLANVDYTLPVMTFGGIAACLHQKPLQEGGFGGLWLGYREPLEAENIPSLIISQIVTTIANRARYLGGANWKGGYLLPIIPRGRDPFGHVVGVRKPKGIDPPPSP